MKENLLRWAWAIFTPLVIIVLIAAFVTDAGNFFWVLLFSALAIGATALISAEWRWPTKLAILVVYLPVMGFIVFFGAIQLSCSLQGCH